MISVKILTLEGSCLFCFVSLNDNRAGSSVWAFKLVQWSEDVEKHQPHLQAEKSDGLYDYSTYTWTHILYCQSLLSLSQRQIRNNLAIISILSSHSVSSSFLSLDSIHTHTTYFKYGGKISKSTILYEKKNKPKNLR